MARLVQSSRLLQTSCWTSAYDLHDNLLVTAKTIERLLQHNHVKLRAFHLAVGQELLQVSAHFGLDVIGQRLMVSLAIDHVNAAELGLGAGTQTVHDHPLVRANALRGLVQQISIHGSDKLLQPGERLDKNLEPNLLRLSTGRRAPQCHLHVATAQRLSSFEISQKRLSVVGASVFLDHLAHILVVLLLVAVRDGLNHVHIISYEHTQS